MVDGLFCSFCGKDRFSLKHLVQGPNASICGECVKLCSDVIREKTMGSTHNVTKNMSPQELKNLVDKYIVSQSLAKRRIIMNILHHYRKFDEQLANPEMSFNKTNMLLYGPTGSGKTELIKSIAKHIDKPYVVFDATTLTETGYVGSDVSEILTSLLQAADGNLQRAQRGIVIIDESDKISRYGAGNMPTSSKDLKEGVQYGLLKMIEGDIVNIPVNNFKKNSAHDTISFDTKQVVFILAGAFQDLTKIVEHRLKKGRIDIRNSSIKDDSLTNRLALETEELSDHLAIAAYEKQLNESRYLDQVLPEDIIAYGLAPELIGRLSILVPFYPLTPSELQQALTQPENAIIKQWQNSFKMYDIQLKFTDNAFIAIVEQSLRLHSMTGVRGLRNVLDPLMLDILYNVAEQTDIEEIIIDAEIIRSPSQEPIIIRRTNKLLVNHDSTS